MTILVLSLLIGIVAGLRAMTAPAVVSWFAALGMIDPGSGWLGLFAHRFAPWILTVLALGEFVTDQLPSTPSRKVPVQFGARIAIGALTGAVLAASSSLAGYGAIAGAIGAVIGTLGGAAARSRLAAAFGRDRPAALIEDVVAVAGAIAICVAASAAGR